jgi:glycosyltransferase involved in cell wall biosynthesis
MKILLVHNNYGKYSGEEAVVDKMATMLQGLGHEVMQLRMSTEGLRDSAVGKIKGFVAGIHSPAGVRAMREALKREKPDVVNVHNLYPFISPAALRECRRAGVPVIMTVHNFRLICPTGLFMRDGGPCEYCLTKGNEWGCVKFNCENSLLKSVGYAARNAVARLKRHYIDCVDKFACITDFQRRKLIEAGFPAEKITVIPNSMDAEVAEEPKTGDYVAFCGRLSREKGIDLIIEVARRHPEIPFKLAGAARDIELIENLPENVELMGYLSGNDLQEFYNNARFFVMASRCYEGFAMAILEGAAYSKPMIAPDHGGFTEIIGTGDDAIGLLFEPGNAEALEAAVIRLWNDETLTRSLGLKANEKLKARYSTDVIARQWESLIHSMCQ